VVTRCSNCERLHGAEYGDGWFPSSYIKSMSSAYCSPATQTRGIDEFMSNYTESTTVPPPAGGRTVASDVLGNKTDVSLYWTDTVSASASGSEATATGAAATGTGSGTASTGSTASRTGDAAGASGTGTASAVGVNVGLAIALVGVSLGVMFGFD
jgi:hypothetical protein